MTDTKTFAARAALIVCAVSLGLSSGARAQDDDKAFAKRVDPTDFTTRADFRNEYQDLPGGGYMNVLVPRFDYAVSKALSLRVELPLVTHDSGQPGAGSDTGVGNVLARVSWRALRREGYSVVVASDFIFDTASEDSLGNGKNVVAPLAFVAVDLPQWRSVFFPFVQHFYSVGGDSSRPDVHQTSIKTAMLTRWPKRTYTFLEGHYIVDHELSDRVGVMLEAELGRFVTPNTGIYARPGVGVHRNDLPQVYNWNIEVGVRHLF